jgi:hypothetical protein
MEAPQFLAGGPNSSTTQNFAPRPDVGPEGDHPDFIARIEAGQISLTPTVEWGNLRSTVQESMGSSNLERTLAEVGQIAAGELAPKENRVSINPAQKGEGAKVSLAEDGNSDPNFKSSWRLGLKPNQLRAASALVSAVVIGITGYASKLIDNPIKPPLASGATQPKIPMAYTSGNRIREVFGTRREEQQLPRLRAFARDENNQNLPVGSMPAYGGIRQQLNSPEYREREGDELIQIWLDSLTRESQDRILDYSVGRQTFSYVNGGRELRANNSVVDSENGGMTGSARARWNYDDEELWITRYEQVVVVRKPNGEEIPISPTKRFSRNDGLHFDGYVGEDRNIALTHRLRRPIILGDRDRECVRTTTQTSRTPPYEGQEIVSTVEDKEKSSVHCLRGRGRR